LWAAGIRQPALEIDVPHSGMASNGHGGHTAGCAEP